jgi:peptide/nickel transport system permease protein
VISYIVRRCGHGLLVVFIVTIVVFSLLHALPGGPARAILGEKANATEIAAFSRANDLTKPLPVQYVLWLGKLVRGNLGYSYTLNQSVLSAIGQRLPKTLILTSLSLLVALLLGVPLGMIQAARRGRISDRVITVLSLGAYSVPIFLCRSGCLPCDGAFCRHRHLRGSRWATSSEIRRASSFPCYRSASARRPSSAATCARRP